ncbi:MAG: glycosyltransferase family 2 protein [Mycobacterium sp.]
MSATDRRPVLDATVPADREYALRRAIDGLRDDDPLRSASVAVVGWQRVVLWSLLVVVVGCDVWQTMATAVVLIGLSTLAYLLTMTDRVLIFRQGLASRAIEISDERARAIPADELPLYTILVPAYNEPEVVGDLIGAMANLDYPRDKPKACNYGLYFSTGEIVTIFDAEDIPEPLQLRRVVAAFRDLGDDVACVQAKLVYHNGHQNILTGWFTAEYGLWFGYLLPGMMGSTSPIPLGGTSNHLRREVLDEIGAWDPFNVTEDADLGLRIAARGYRTAVIDSHTLEEANSDPINWIRQRSRWYKGYLQTWLVHIRRPVELYRVLGLRSFVRFTLVLAGTPVIAVLNLVFWLITLVWFLGQPSVIEDVFPVYIYFPALIALVLGNAATLYMNLIALREDDRSDLLVAGLTVPAFWLMMSVAAAKGCYQMICNPSYWEKTFHGLSAKPPETEGGL